MQIPFVVAAFLVLLGCVVGQIALHGRETRKSPRKKQLEILYDAGCRNKIVAHYVIDMARNPSLQTNELTQRLDGIELIPLDQQNQITAWISAVQPYV